MSLSSVRKTPENDGNRFRDLLMKKHRLLETSEHALGLNESLLLTVWEIILFYIECLYIRMYTR